MGNYLKSNNNLAQVVPGRRKKPVFDPPKIVVPIISYVKIDTASLSYMETIQLWLKHISSAIGKNIKILKGANKVTINSDLKILQKKKLGEGTYGDVFLILDKTGVERAMKIISCKT